MQRNTSRWGVFGASLRAIRDQLEFGRGFYLIRGIPTERLSLPEARLLLLVIGLHLGRPVPQNLEGELVSSVRDMKKSTSRDDRTRGYQTGLALPFHSDSCDIVGLLCLHKAKSGGTSSIASTYAIHNTLFDERLDLLESLYQPFCIDKRDEGAKEGPSYYLTPIFMWHGDRLFCRFNPGYIYSAQRHLESPRLTRQQVAAIEMFKKLCASDNFRLDMNFQPGDLQLLNNNIIVHARSAYQDCADVARKRHLLRLWLLTSDLSDIPIPMRDRYCDMEKWQTSWQSLIQQV